MWFNYFADGDEDKEFLGTFECRVNKNHQSNIVKFKDITDNDEWAYATEGQVFPSKQQALKHLASIIKNKIEAYNEWLKDVDDEINSLPF